LAQSHIITEEFSKERQFFMQRNAEDSALVSKLTEKISELEQKYNRELTENKRIMADMHVENLC